MPEAILVNPVILSKWVKSYKVWDENTRHQYGQFFH
jgi:hypothetical protein